MRMKSITGLIVVINFVGWGLGSSIARSANSNLKDLPDQTRIRIPQMIPVSLDILDNNVFLFYTHFDNRIIHRNLKFGSVFNYMDSGVTIQTDNIDAIHDRIENGLILKDMFFFLKTGTYCLNKTNSKFHSRNLNILSVYDCKNAKFRFNLYVNAGWSLRNRSDFQGLTVRDLHDQVGNYMQLIQ